MNKKIDIENIDNKHVFTTPDRYFEDLPTRIQKRIEKEKRNDVFQRSFQFFNELEIWRLAIPAIAVVILVILIIPKGSSDNFTKVEDTQVLLASVDDESIMDYLDLMGISEIDLLSTLDNEELASEILVESESQYFDQLDIENIDLELLGEFDVEPIDALEE